MPTRIAHRGTALLILDMLSEFRFPDALRLLPSALRIAPRIARLRAHARASGMPVIYVNDTRGKWESDQTAFVKRCREPGARGSEIARQLQPAPEDYFIFKPRHSAFYATPLKELLERLEAATLVLTGQTSHQCVLFTAMDAYVRKFSLVVPPDCIGAPTAAHTRHALFILEEALKARTPLSASLRFR